MGAGGRSLVAIMLQGMEQERLALGHQAILAPGASPGKRKDAAFFSSSLRNPLGQRWKAQRLTETWEVP